MYRMARLLSTLPVGKDMEKLLNYYLNNMLMSTSVRRYETLLHTLVYYAVANIHVVYTHQLLQIESNIYTSELHM